MAQRLAILALADSRVGCAPRSAVAARQYTPRSGWRADRDRPVVGASLDPGACKLNAAADAAGGAQALRGMTAIGFTARGDTYNDVQGFHASHIGAPERDGREVDVRGVSLFQIRSGKIARWYDYYDVLTFQLQTR